MIKKGYLQVRQKVTSALDNLRLRLSAADALPQLAVLGILCGIFAALVIVLFRSTIELGQLLLLPDNSENYEGLGVLARLSLPLIGAAVIALLFKRTKSESQQVGVTHVMERLAYHQGRLPTRNALVQFVAGAISIVFGHSVGREGPAIHLGATIGTLPGRRMGLPNNSLRILAACGVAAAIAAAFNTPLAGVVFTMEVIVMEYTVIGFAPVILAAFSATAISHLAYGAAPAFAIPAISIGSAIELPYIMLMGIVVGVIATVFKQLLRFFATHFSNLTISQRLLLAGLAVSLCALPAPQVMGIGYDTVDAALLGQIAIGSVLLILAFKLLATAAGLGLGLPGGLIGPVLFIGAICGAGAGIGWHWLAPEHASSAGLYALIGMGAMMAGTLHAPLAALVTILELSANTGIIWPGMLAVIASYMTSKQLFGQESVYSMLLHARGLHVKNDPIHQSLRRVGVGAAMERNVIQLERVCNRATIESSLEKNPRWVVIERDGALRTVLPAVDLARQLSEFPEQNEFDLLELPADRLQLAPIHLTETLQEAADTLDETQAEALYVWALGRNGQRRVMGILTVTDIERNYRL